MIRPPFTLSILVACWLIFALNFFWGGDRIILLGAVIPSAITAGQWWRLVTAGFIHFGLAHIALNSYALFWSGRFAEWAYGTMRFAIIYAIALIAGDVAAYYTTMESGAITAGASGAIMGVFGSMIGLAVRLPGLRRPLLNAALLPVILTLGYGILNAGTISNAAHIGGLVIGALVGLAMPPTARARRASEAALAYAAAESEAEEPEM